MNIGQALNQFVSAWTASVARAVVAGFDRVASPRSVRLIEGVDNCFAVEAKEMRGSPPATIRIVDGELIAPNLAAVLRGSRVEVVLAPKRFLFRPLQLPARATDFLDGIVRAQIDRLTPWNASEAVFGHSAPMPGPAENITAVVAATTRKVAAGYVDAIAGFHPATVAIVAEAGVHAKDRIRVFEQKARGHLNADRLGQALRIALYATAVGAVATLSVAGFVSDRLASQQDEVAQRISQRRAAIRVRAEHAEQSPAAALERRKFETPASVIVLDVLSQVLPDHTYVTELHLASSKLQIVGITRDAPSLIQLMEQSQHFSRATFYAPTTRTPSDPGERFHIEARVQPRNTMSP